jgi:hypothetical protein
MSSSIKLPMRCATIYAAAAVVGLCLFGAPAARAAPMLCSGEFKTCTAGCTTITNRTVASACISNCRARQTNCKRSGCWQGPTNTYCGLLKQ